MAKFNFSDYEQQKANASEQGSRARVSYLALKNDGDEAIVRFMYNSPADLSYETVHDIVLDGRHRKVSCLKSSLYGPVDQCPLCAAQVSRPIQKMYVKLLEYIRNEQNEIVAVPKIWERPASFMEKLKSYFDEGYELSNCIFKIKRHGKAGDTQTTYEIIPANPNIYKPEFYVKDESLFDNYSLSTYVVMEKTFSELQYFVEKGSFPVEKGSIPTEQKVEQPAVKRMENFPSAQPQQTYQQTSPMTHQYTGTYTTQKSPSDAYAGTYSTQDVPTDASKSATDASVAAPRPIRRYNY